MYFCISPGRQADQHQSMQKARPKKVSLT